MTPILGLETEYAFVFTPQVGSPAPVQERIYEVLAHKLRQEHLALEAAYRKGGFFLANGGLVHYEAENDDLHRGLLEMATPECSGPREVLAYHRAQERIIEELLPAVSTKLEEAGFQGELVIGKGSSDYHGHTFGSHENYLVHDAQSILQRALLLVGVLVYQVIKLPFFTLPAILLNLLTVIGYAVPVLYTHWELRRSRSDEAGAAEPGRSAIFDVSQKAVEWLLQRRVALGQLEQRLEQRYLLPPFARFVSSLVLSRFQGEFLTFLVTRPIFCGPGWLETCAQRKPFGFVLSPKASSIRAVVETHDPARKPIIDLKCLFGSPLAVLAPLKRLHVSYSDSNMSEYALWLKVGTTFLVIRMLEAGRDVDRLQLEDVLGSLEVVNHDLTLERTLRLADGRRLTSLEIQQRFLAGARAFVESGEHGFDAALLGECREILAAWDGVLDQLARDPRDLEDRLDWVAKKSLIDEALGADGWDLANRVAPVVNWLEEENLGLGRVADSPHQVKEFFARRLNELEMAQLTAHMERSGLAWETLPRAYKLYYQAKKIDLKYHQIGRDGGYFQQLEREGVVRRLLAPAEIHRAVEEPPERTRAHARARYTQESVRLGLDILVGWDQIIVPRYFEIIPLSDPASPVVPLEISVLRQESLLRILPRLVTFLPRIHYPF